MYFFLGIPTCELIYLEIHFLVGLKRLWKKILNVGWKVCRFLLKQRGKAYIYSSMEAWMAISRQIPDVCLSAGQRSWEGSPATSSPTNQYYTRLYEYVMFHG